LQYLVLFRKKGTSAACADETGQFLLFGEDAPEMKTENIPSSLLVVPTSLLHNWMNEIKRFAPGLKVYLYSGIKRIKSKDIGKIFKHYDIVITTYGILRNDIDLLHPVDFFYLILDESQYVKNPASLTYKAVKQIQASHKLALTGTPIENSLSDLWAQFDIVNEGMLGNYSLFKKAYINPIIQKKSKEKEEILLKMIRPFLLRRTKEEVTPELPPLLEEVIYCDMSEEQKDYYKKEKNRVRNVLIRNLDRQSEVLPSKASLPVLQGLTRLRLSANHPALADRQFDGSSGKFEQVILQFESLKAGNHKVLIFSSFVKHLKLFADYFDKQSWKYAWLTGATGDREKEIKYFSEQQDVNCFFISLKAGGVGLNLTAADYVFILDPWWNPAAEMQAVARAHRIGQEQNVMVYRFISIDTIEEKIVKLQQEKSELVETFINAKNVVHLSMKEIDELLI
jgi:SNF2 family DNA or RNA helicase